MDNTNAPMQKKTFGDHFVSFFDKYTPNAMGYLSGYFAYNMTPTISMTVAYLHPVSMEYPLLMEACADWLSDHINYMSVRAYQPDCPERILAEASGTYAVS